MKSKNNEKKNIKTDCEIVDEAMCAYDEYKDIYMFNDSTRNECKYDDIPEEMKEKLKALARERARKWYLENKEYKNQYDKDRRIEKQDVKDKRMIIVYDEIDDKKYGCSPKWFSEEDKIIKKVYSSSNDSDDVCNLFMKETNDGNNFFYIKNMNSFIRDECKKNKKIELCINCCEGFDKRYKHNCST
jgi:hypothetical protein